MIDDFAAPLPDDLGCVPARRSRPDRGLAAGRARRALPVGRRRHRPRRRDDAPRTCGRAARPRAAACTARTGSRRTRCSTGSCSGARVVEAIVAGKDAARIDRRDDRRARPARRRRAPTPIRSCCRRSGADRPDAVRGALQRTMSADCGVVRDADGLAARGDDARRSRALADDLPARSIASYEVIDLLRVSRAIVASATGAHGVAGRAHAPRLSRTVRRRCSAGSCSAAAAAPRLRRAAAASSREVGDERLRSAPRRSCAGSSRPRSPKTSASSATSRRSRASTKTQTRGGGVRRPRRRRARRHRARDRDVPPGRRRRSRCSGASHDGDPVAAGARARPGVGSAARRSSPASASRSTSCATARASPR